MLSLNFFYSSCLEKATKIGSQRIIPQWETWLLRIRQVLGEGTWSLGLGLGDASLQEEAKHQQ